MQQSETNVIMTPELRNDIIRKAIQYLNKYSNSGVCNCLYDSAFVYGLDRGLFDSYKKVFDACIIPFIFNPREYYWPIKDRESRISFLKAQITC